MRLQSHPAEAAINAICRENESEIIAHFEWAVLAKEANSLDIYFESLRDVYRLMQPEIDAGIYRPNVVDWPRIMSPIEREAWIDIQQRRLRMFPQYPALHYFLYFAEPWQKVAIECDGKQWHTDHARDEKRDSLLRLNGWQVCRVSGKAIWRERRDDDDLQILRGCEPFRHWLDNVYWFDAPT